MIRYVLGLWIVERLVRFKLGRVERIGTGVVGIHNKNI